MPLAPAIGANLGEWRTIPMTLTHGKENLTAALPSMGDEESELIAYDQLERLDRLISRLQAELDEAAGRRLKNLPDCKDAVDE